MSDMSMLYYLRKPRMRPFTMINRVTEWNVLENKHNQRIIIAILFIFTVVSQISY